MDRTERFYKIKELLRFTPDRIDHSFAELCSPKDQKLTAKGKRSDFKHYLSKAPDVAAQMGDEQV